jgi:hypothetical protein
LIIIGNTLPTCEISGSHALMMEALRTSETSVYFNETTRRCILAGCSLPTNYPYPDCFAGEQQSRGDAVTWVYIPNNRNSCTVRNCTVISTESAAKGHQYFVY